MKIAVCLSGSIGNFSKNIDSLVSELINPLERIGHVDIFMSVWDNVDYNLLKHLPISPSLSIKKFDREHFIQKYTRDEFDGDILLKRMILSDHVQTWYQISESYKMIHQPENYDLILCARPNILYYDSIKLKDILTSFTDSSVIYMPEPDLFFSHQGYNSDLAFGSPEAMNYYCSLFDNICTGENEEDFEEVGEDYLATHMKNNPNIEVRHTELQYMI